MLNLPLCLGVIKHRVLLVRGMGAFSAMEFCLCGAILNLKVFCFGAIPDIMIELIIYGSADLLQDPGKGPPSLTSTGPQLSQIRHWAHCGIDIEPNFSGTRYNPCNVGGIRYARRKN